MTTAEKRQLDMLLGKWASRRAMFEEDRFRHPAGRAIVDAQSDALKTCAAEIGALLSTFTIERGDSASAAQRLYFDDVHEEGSGWYCEIIDRDLAKTVARTAFFPTVEAARQNAREYIDRYDRGVTRQSMLPPRRTAR